VTGPVHFSSSGIANIAAGAASVTVNPGVAVDATMKVLCTLMSNPGGATTVQRVAKGTGNFQIFLTANATTACDVAWFVIS
jgi:hypothetical protein